AFGLFAVLVLSVGPWLDGIFPTLRDYILLVLRDITRGANSYANLSSFQFVHLGFFQSNIVNWLLKALLLALYAAALVRIARRDRKDGKLTAAEWGAFTTMTMAISYHRAYDCVLFMPFVGVLFVERWRAMCSREKAGSRQKLDLLAVAAILVFWTLPMGRVLAWGNMVGGSFPAGERIFRYSHAGGRSIFPFYQIMMLLSTLALFVSALSQRSGDTEKTER
ncbi:MAG: hypothetical protein IJJ28_06380, partial [Lentisphaeria bacterium]|nr:hypothetical protein [Lentisphaeria bacterium]